MDRPKNPKTGKRALTPARAENNEPKITNDFLRPHRNKPALQRHDVNFMALQSSGMTATPETTEAEKPRKQSYPAATKEAAADLFWQGHTLTEIEGKLGVPYTTLTGWRTREKWDTNPVSVLVDISISARIKVLLRKDQKTKADYDELNFLMGQQRRYELHRARIDGLLASHGVIKAKDGNAKLSQRGRKTNAEKNSFSDEQLDELRAIFFNRMYDYQKRWWNNRDKRIRNILKSRQIGATYYFAFEALIDALETGRSKVFLSASKNQAHIFRDYIKAFAGEVGVELEGTDKIILANGAILRFVSTNASTAQGFNGDLYVDEYFWIAKYKTLRKVASGMSSQSRWRTTYFSTPSAITHEAYTWWDGTHFNSKSRPKSQHLHLDVSADALRDGRLDADGQWRNIVTILDAEAQGCNLFDIKQLRIEYTPEEFDNLFMCVFVDDTASLFSFEKLVALLVNAEKWTDYDPTLPRPFGGKVVWIGFDPSLTIDRTSCVVLAPPEPGYNKFRVLERYQWRGKGFEYQAGQIRLLMERFNVQEIAIDKTGIGNGTAEHVRPFFPRLKEVNFNPEVKAELITKGLDVVETRRMEIPDDWHDLIKSMLQLYITTSDGGNLAYKARRNQETGHADLAFALLLALSFEKMNYTTRRRSRVRVNRHAA